MPNPTTDTGSKLRAVSDNPERTAAKSIKLPPLPKSLSPTLKKEWQAIIKHMQAQDAWVPEKSSMVEVYLVNLQALREAQDRMTADGGVITPAGKVHPSSAVIARHSGFLTKLGPQLGLGRENLIASPAATAKKPKTSNWGA